MSALQKAGRACSGGGNRILGLYGARATALLRCALRYAAREILHAHLLPGHLCRGLQ